MTNFQHTKDTHMALAQYHRWYQAYEVEMNDARIANQLDILDPEVEITSGHLGTTKGTDGIGERLLQFKGWRNAHHVQRANVERLNDTTLKLQADIHYQNIRPDESRYSYAITYTTELALQQDGLPKFTVVNIQPTGELGEFEFQDAYADNRGRSFMHYWLYLMETASTHQEAFKELLAPSFKLNLSTSAPVTTWEAFQAWLTTTASSVKDSAHTVKNFSAEQAADGTITVSVDFDWEGLTQAGEKMIAETHHEWVLENNLDERFARMKKMNVTQTVPFQVVK
ncbi:hypothetical protein A374_06081 [Fictibacillus macauensis ZFHKF-1]|uniref:Uncharacterized protein n=1 Tax=Fictibacillus macauensis ZFHKF-1 TaxID=1196324 RepID=I8AKP4_9BACL|nr:hypothetical protein [Fictibacillus macauensis]EIT86144.1 hypothetical protein A374_06081 [Fictibacillus macauensis ZFHKF-1]